MNTDESKQVVAHGDELNDLIVAWSTYRGHILGGLVVVLVVGLGAWFFVRSSRQSVEEASRMVSTARSVDDLVNVVRQYPSSPSAPVALIMAAKAYYDQGGYDLAMAQYEEFKQKYPDHEWSEAATLGIVHCMEAMGRLEDALNGYGAFLAAQPGHFLSAEAVMGQGRCLQMLGRNAEARSLYEDFMAANPQSGWTPRMKELLEVVNRRIKVGSQVMAMPGPVIAQPAPVIEAPATPGAAPAPAEKTDL